MSIWSSTFTITRLSTPQTLISWWLKFFSWRLVSNSICQVSDSLKSTLRITQLLRCRAWIRRTWTQCQSLSARDKCALLKWIWWVKTSKKPRPTFWVWSMIWQSHTLKRSTAVSLNKLFRKICHHWCTLDQTHCWRIRPSTISWIWQLLSIFRIILRSQSNSLWCKISSAC